MGRGVYRSAGFLSSAVLKQTVEVIPETKDGRDIAELLERTKGRLQKHDLEVLFAKYGCEHLLQRYLPLVP